MLSFLVAGNEELVVPPRPTAFAQWTLGRVLEEFVSLIVLPDGDKPFWVQHEEAVVNNLILSCKLFQFEDVIVVVTVIVILSELQCANEGEKRHLRPVCFIPPMDDVWSTAEEGTYGGG